jgi:hypothetical protein
MKRAGLWRQRGRVLGNEPPPHHALNRPIVLALMLGETVCDWAVELCEQIEREWKGNNND